MKTFLNLLALLIALFISSLSPAACFADDGWVSLFDGTTLTGWKQAEHGRAEYKVLDETIYGKTVEGSPNSFLMSEKQYGDFELEFEVKVHDVGGKQALGVVSIDRFVECRAVPIPLRVKPVSLDVVTEESHGGEPVS